MGADGHGLTSGASIKWPFEELQFLALCWLHVRAFGLNINIYQV